MESSTRISDLPDANVSVGYSNPQKPAYNEPSINYAQMNVHPNPYGNEGPTQFPNPQIQPPKNKMGSLPPQFGQNQDNVPQHNVFGQNQPPQNTMFGENQNNVFGQNQPPQNNVFGQNQPPQQRLPSRDIPHDTTGYLQDERIQANYIPPTQALHDYVREYESVTEKKIEKHNQENHRKDLFDTIVEKLQIPVLVGILFFLFHLSFFETAIMKHLSFLPIYSEGGVLNTNGLLLKSGLFGSGIFVLLHGLSFLSES